MMRSTLVDALLFMRYAIDCCRCACVSLVGLLVGALCLKLPFVWSWFITLEWFLAVRPVIFAANAF